MKILIIHQYYKTPEDGGAIRSYHIARYLTQQGHEVSVITAFNQKKYAKKMVDDVTVHYLPIYYTNHLSFLSRIHAFMRYVWQAKRLIRKLEKADLHYVISTPLTTGFIALYGLRRFGVPYVFEVGDLWPDAPVELKVIRNSLIKRLAYKLERKVYENAQSIVALSTDIKQRISSKINKPVEVITNLSDTDYFSAHHHSVSYKSKLGYDDKFIVAYIGTVGMANHLEYLLDAAQVSIQNPKIQFIVMGSGARWDTISSQAVSRGLTNIDFYPSGDKERAREMLYMADAVYVSFKDVPVLSSGSPNKFFDGLAAGKLIIVNFGGWIKDLLHNYNCGFYCNPHSPEGFMRKLQPFVEDSEVLNQFQKSARKLAEEEFALEKQLPRLNEILTR